MFVLHEMLEKDTVFVCEWPLSVIRLMNDSRYPWLVLVPQVEGARDIHDLDDAGQAQLMREMSAASMRIARLYGTDKTNVAALGNMVAQLHVHVIGRFVTDDAWPGPVWGAHPPLPYGDGELAATLEKIRSELAQVFA